MWQCSYEFLICCFDQSKIYKKLWLYRTQTPGVFVLFLCFLIDSYQKMFLSHLDLRVERASQWHDTAVWQWSAFFPVTRKGPMIWQEQGLWRCVSQWSDAVLTMGTWVGSHTQMHWCTFVILVLWRQEQEALWDSLTNQPSPTLISGACLRKGKCGCLLRKTCPRLTSDLVVTHACSHTYEHRTISERRNKWIDEMGGRL